MGERKTAIGVATSLLCMWSGGVGFMLAILNSMLNDIMHGIGVPHCVRHAVHDMHMYMCMCMSWYRALHRAYGTVHEAIQYTS